MKPLVHLPGRLLAAPAADGKRFEFRPPDAQDWLVVVSAAKANQP